MEGLIILLIAFVAGVIVAAVFFTLTLQRTLNSCSQENRQMEGGMVWLSWIPFFGLGWMINKLQKTPPSRMPRIKNREDLMSLLQTLFLQDLVSDLAYKKGVHLSSSFKKDLKTNYKNIVYNEYVSFFHLI